jgi:hypothetical protein
VGYLAADVCNIEGGLSFLRASTPVEAIRVWLKNLKKSKVARRGLYSTAALYIADCALAP